MTDIVPVNTKYQIKYLHLFLPRTSSSISDFHLVRHASNTFISDCVIYLGAGQRVVVRVSEISFSVCGTCDELDDGDGWSPETCGVDLAELSTTGEVLFVNLNVFSRISLIGAGLVSLP